MANVILLDGEAREEDFIAAAAVTPGELIEHASTEGQVQANGTAADPDAIIMFAREQIEHAGHGIEDTIASGDTVTALLPTQGAKVNALLATGNDVSQGDALESDGAGALQAQSSGRTVAFAAEDLNNSSGNDLRIRAVAA